jgi:hypothetical protein
MKDIIKEILIHQLNECKIEPMVFIEYNKFVDRITNEQANKIAGAIATRYPKAIANIQAKIDGLEQARIQNPSLTPKINKHIIRLRNIQNKYRLKQQAWMVRANTPK